MFLSGQRFSIQKFFSVKNFYQLMRRVDDAIMVDHYNKRLGSIAVLGGDG